jgi:hypothetical protein
MPQLPLRRPPLRLLLRKSRNQLQSRLKNKRNHIQSQKNRRLRSNSQPLASLILRKKMLPNWTKLAKKSNQLLLLRLSLSQSQRKKIRKKRVANTNFSTGYSDSLEPRILPSTPYCLVISPN